VKYNGKMDRECLGLCDAMNALPGITTTESCCGHGLSNYHIWFRVREVQDLTPLHRAINHLYGGLAGWRIEVSWTENPTYSILFDLVGPIGHGAYCGAEKIASGIREER